MNYLSVCSGIEAASVAWAPLGWRPLVLSEIENFPRAVLQDRVGVEDARYSRNGTGPLLWGDFTSIKRRFLSRLGVDMADIDVLVGGTPCQSFSHAGLRRSLSDDRGNLALQFVRLANAIDNLRRHHGKPPVTIVWENVPGVLTTQDNAFGCFLGAMVGSNDSLVPPGRAGWTDAGVVDGPKRCAAWRCLDAQHFGLAQRRKRVFVLSRGGSDPWGCADALLPVIDSMRWHSAPSREQGQDVAGSLAARAKGGCGFEPGGGSSRPSRVTETHIPGSGTSTVSSQVLNGIEGGVSHALTARHSATGRYDPNGETFIAHTLTGGGFDASDDGTGRGTPLVVTPLQSVNAVRDKKQNGICIGDAHDPMFTLTARDMHAIAFDETQITSKTNRSNPQQGDPSDPLAAGARPPTIAFRTTGNDGAYDAGDQAPCLGTGTDPNHTVLMQPNSLSGVRRIMPVEAARLQGFSDDYLDITYRGKPAADGPKYKALGNSMAVPVMRYIGERIEAVMGNKANKSQR